jgi:uncharacterized protein involved in exopolysaccharide biosynthesis
VLYRPETEPIERQETLDIEVHDDREPTLEDYARVVWGGRWLILALVAAATTAALIVSLITPKSFTAQTTIMPLGQDRGGGLASALSGSLGGSLGIENPNDKLVAVLQSRKVAGMVIEGLGLETVLAQASGRKPTRDEAIEAVQKDVVKVSGGTRGVITVRAQWRDPALAAAIANATVSAAGRFLNERSISMNFQVLDEAVPPTKKSGPKIWLNVAVAAVLSALAALMIVFVREYVRGVRGRKSFNGRRAPDSAGSGFPAG